MSIIFKYKNNSPRIYPPITGTILIGGGNGGCYIWNAGNGNLLRHFPYGAPNTDTLVYGWLNQEHVLLSTGVLAISSGDTVGELISLTEKTGVANTTPLDVATVVSENYVCRREHKRKEQPLGSVHMYLAMNVPAACQSSLEYASKKI